MDNHHARIVIRHGSQQEKEHILSENNMTIGRERINDIVVNDPEVSRRHSRIAQTQDGYTIEDLGSTNGTFVNGQRITTPTRLYHGDTLEFGESIRVVFLNDKSVRNLDAAIDEMMGGATEVLSSAGFAPISPTPMREPAVEVPRADPLPMPGMVQDNDPAYYAAPEPAPYKPQAPVNGKSKKGCRQYLVGFGCVWIVVLVLLAVAMFVLDRSYPSLLYCGPLQPLWDTVLSPLLELFGKELTCVTP